MLNYQTIKISQGGAHLIQADNTLKQIVFAY